MQATLKRRLIDRERIQRYGAIAMFLALFAYNCFFTRGFFQIRVLLNLIIMRRGDHGGLGMTLVIATGNINIAVGSLLGLGAVGFALSVKAGGSPALGLLYTILLGAFIGLLFGILVSKFRVQSMIVTMSGMTICGASPGARRGLAGQLQQRRGFGHLLLQGGRRDPDPRAGGAGADAAHVPVGRRMALRRVPGASGDNEHAAYLAGIDTGSSSP